MKSSLVITLALVTSFSLSAFAQDDVVTPRELFNKVGEAMVFIMENGDVGVTSLGEKAADNPFIWKDTYVFVFNCAEKILASHPNPNLVNNKKVWNLKDPKGKYIIRPLCKATKQSENGGWYDYLWPKKQSKTSKTTAEKMGDKETIERKISFCVQVPDTPYQVCAGIYDDSLSVSELNQKIKEWMK